MNVCQIHSCSVICDSDTCNLTFDGAIYEIVSEYQTTLDTICTFFQLTIPDHHLTFSYTFDLA